MLNLLLGVRVCPFCQGQGYLDSNRGRDGEDGERGNGSEEGRA
ncbi:hypothetical protein Esi_0083_0031 [Ectocarpus siliculosus]|uniref:Uncharacterized protein n=1 Tax=Ectocarpus siliculosus TaxID=2880 RepID=D7G7G4_ECTSI|nr:hypothetical protein Esi_0083_0031 [Ectocarpus siliculosus]|eukprot:CBJ27706.1 hypothetical protein Esi_0083_0031 [Ectocarpus siliculosus]